MARINPKQQVDSRTESPPEVLARRLKWHKKPARRRKRKKTHKGGK